MIVSDPTKTDKVGKRPNSNSWLNWCFAHQAEVVNGDPSNPASFKFWGLLLESEVNLGDKDGDFDYRVKRFDRIDKLAKRFYGDVMLWWVIALRNDLRQPAVDLFDGRVIVTGKQMIHLFFLRYHHR